MANTAIAHPVEILRQYISDLEAAIQLCLDKPAKAAVHRLRTMTRRIEAQIALLNLLHVPKANNQQARTARRLLKKIRRAAAKVRDSDVLRELIATHTPPGARNEARQLRETLGQQRAGAARELQEILGKHHTRLTENLEALLKLLDEGTPLSLAPPELRNLALDWFAHNTPAPSNDPASLHTIRKKAKIARYLAENAPKKARSARQIAEAFEALQQSGGEWHDWLILSEIAREETGKSSPLTGAFTRRCQRALSNFRRHLTEGIPTA